jgi:nucleoside-diphosphate-sugar epimerase
VRVVITGQGMLPAALTQALRVEHDVVTTGNDLRDAAAMARLVDGAAAVVHLAPIAPGLPAGTTASERLDAATRGSYVLLQAAVAAGVRRVVQGSTLELFARYPASWAVGEDWQPLPDVTDLAQLAAHLAEQSAQQVAHVAPIEVVCLRFGTLVDEATAGGRRDARWLHLDDAVRACQLALTRPLHLGDAPNSDRPGQGWRVYHIPGGGRHTRIPLARAGEERGLGYIPTHDLAPPRPLPASAAERAGDLTLLAPPRPIPSRPIRRVALFGAGGPLGAVTARALASSYQLRLTDLRDLAAIAAEGKPQSPGAPLPAVLPPPHETLQADVTDAAQVERACAGMDAIVNCTVIRPDPVQAFRVNCLGAYHVMRAAVAHGIRRVVHTGPLQVSNDGPAGYGWDFAVPDDAPARPGFWLYAHSKYLGQEIVRCFAEHYGLEAPALYYSSFVDPATARPQPGGVHPMSISWEDAGLAMRRALEAPTLPRPFEVFHILTDLPHGKYSSAKARRLLGWQPRDSLAHLWARRV